MSHRSRAVTSDSILSLSFGLLVIANFLFFGSMYLLMATLPVYAAELGGQPAQVGLVIGMFAITAVMARPYAGQLVDRLGRKAMALIGAAIFFAAPLLYNLATTIPMLMAARMFHGIGIACFTTAATTWVADIVPDSRRAQAIGLYGVSSLTAMSLGPALGTTILEDTSFPFLFAVSAGAALGAFLAGALAPPGRSIHATENAGHLGFWQAIRVRGIWVPTLATLTCATSYGTVLSFLPLYAMERKLPNFGGPLPFLSSDLDVAPAGGFFFIYALATVAVRLTAGRLFDRMGRRRAAIPVMLLVAFTFWLFPEVTTLAWLALIAVLYGAGFGSAQPVLNALVVDKAPLQARGAAVGIFGAGFDLGIAIGSFLGGVAAAAVGYAAMYALTGTIVLAGCLAFVYFLRG
ncbi:MAG: MFS transporter [Chloroflexota bacterium]